MFISFLSVARIRNLRKPKRMRENTNEKALMKNALMSSDEKCSDEKCSDENALMEKCSDEKCSDEL